MSEQSFHDLQSENVTLKETVNFLNQEVARLNHNLMLLKKSVYGSKSEKIEVIPEQMVFNELEKAIRDDGNPSDNDTTEVGSHKRKIPGRGPKKPYPDHLPREEVVIDLAESEKICPHDGSQLVAIGVEVIEKLKVVPAQMSVVVEKHIKYGCLNETKHLVQAKCNSILPGTTATVETIAFLFFSKFFQGLPLYRIEEMLKLQRVTLSRGTMASWLIAVAEKLQPIWNILEEWALASGYMGIDATSVQVLNEPGRKATTKSFMWARGSPELGIVLFDYDISGAGYVAERLTAGFAGALQADAHKAYDRLVGILRLGCMMHARRKFFEAYLAVKKQPGLAENAVKMIKKIYGFEERYKQEGLTSAERHRRRQLEVRPALEKLKQWCEEKTLTVLPKSPLGVAIRYFLDEYEHLAAFLESGRYEIDNGWIERAIRKFAIGRNNWLFSATQDGAWASALYYSLSITAKLNGKDPNEVMVEVLRKINDAKSIEDYEALAKLFVNKSQLH